MSNRSDQRENNQIRPCTIERNYLKHAEGSVLISMGHTKVIVSVSIDHKIPRFLKGKCEGWLTAEYSMLPRATHSRTDREATKGKQKGRTVEIQRLIGRSLRAMLDLKALGEATIMIDCDVIQADGGTRTASITGAAVALIDAITKIYPDKQDKILVSRIAAISVGICQGNVIADLDYPEDSTAQTDMNVIMNNHGGIIEVQGTAEQQAFSRDELDRLLDSATAGIHQLLSIQKQALNT